MTTRRFNVAPIVWLILIVFYGSCKPKKTAPGPEAAREPATVFKQLDVLMRKQSFDYDSLQKLLSDMKGSFQNALTKEKNYRSRSTRVTYCWNPDSTLAMIHAYKAFPKGFSREVMLHVGDSVLFLHRFSTQPMDAESPENYTFLEAVQYLKETGTIKHVSRIQYDQSTLADTIAFMQKLFSDLTDPRYHYYSMELDYARHIFED